MFSGSHRACKLYDISLQDKSSHDRVQQYWGFSIHSSQFTSQLHQGQFCISPVQILLQLSQVHGITGTSGSSIGKIQELLQTWKSPVMLLIPFESWINRWHCLQGQLQVKVLKKEK